MREPRLAQLVVRCEIAVKARIEAEAKKSGKTVANYVRGVLDDHLARQAKKAA